MPSESVYDLRFEMDNRHGRYMILSRQPALQRGDMARLEENMLRNANIPRLLPLDVEEVNAEILFHYRLPAARTIKQVLETEVISPRQALLLLYAVAEILDDSRTYMLRENRYVLHPDFVFVGSKGDAEVWMAYLPLNELPSKPSVRQELYQLALLLMEPTGTDLPAKRILFDCLKSSLFQISDFKQLVASLLLETGPLQACQEDVTGAEAKLVPQTASVSRSLAEPLQLLTDEQPKPAGRSSAILEEDSYPVKRLAAIPDKVRRDASLTLFPLLAVWAIAAWQPTALLLLSAAGLTILTGILLYYRLRTSRRSKPGDESEFADWSRGVAPVIPAVNEPEPEHVPVRERSFPWQEADSRLYAMLPAETVCLRPPPDETVLLKPEERLQQAAAYLETERDGELQQIFLTGDRFIIGRKKGEADHVLDSPEISRLHGEFDRQAGGWLFKDLDSRNGSSRNGALIPAGEAISLEDGDIITIGRIDFIFRSGVKP